MKEDKVYCVVRSRKENSSKNKRKNEMMKESAQTIDDIQPTSDYAGTMNKLSAKWNVYFGETEYYNSKDILDTVIEMVLAEEENWNNCLIDCGIRHRPVREMVYHTRPRYFKAGFVNRRVKRI